MKLYPRSQRIINHCRLFGRISKLVSYRNNLICLQHLPYQGNIMYRSYPVSQTEIENMLFEKYDKNLARIHSLVNINFIILALYLPIFTFVSGYFGANTSEGTSLDLDSLASIIKSDHKVVSVWSLSLGIICIILSFYILVLQTMRDEHKFKKDRHPTEGYFIQVRTGKELQNHNVELFSLINKQNNGYAMALVFSVFALMLLYNFYSGISALLYLIIILGGLLVLVYLIGRIPLIDDIRKYESHEAKIKKIENEMQELIKKLDVNIHK